MGFGWPEWIDFRLRGNDIYFESPIYATMLPWAGGKLRVPLVIIRLGG